MNKNNAVTVNVTNPYEDYYEITIKGIADKDVKYVKQYLTEDTVVEDSVKMMDGSYVISVSYKDGHSIGSQDLYSKVRKYIGYASNLTKKEINLIVHNWYQPYQENHWTQVMKPHEKQQENTNMGLSPLQMLCLANKGNMGGINPMHLMCLGILGAGQDVPKSNVNWLEDKKPKQQPVQPKPKHTRKQKAVKPVEQVEEVTEPVEKEPEQTVDPKKAYYMQLDAAWEEAQERYNRLRNKTYSREWNTFWNCPEQFGIHDYGENERAKIYVRDYKKYKKEVDQYSRLVREDPEGYSWTYYQNLEWATNALNRCLDMLSGGEDKECQRIKNERADFARRHPGPTPEEAAATRKWLEDNEKERQHRIYLKELELHPWG